MTQSQHPLSTGAPFSNKINRNGRTSARVRRTRVCRILGGHLIPISVRDMIIHLIVQLVWKSHLSIETTPVRGGPSQLAQLEPCQNQTYPTAVPDSYQTYPTAVPDSYQTYPTAVPDSYQTHPTAVPDSYQTHPTAVPDSYQTHPTAVPDSYQTHPTAVPDSYQTHPTAVPDSYQTHPTGVPDSYQTHPTAVPMAGCCLHL